MSGRLDLAKSEFEWVVSEKPDKFEALFWLSIVARRQLRYEDAIEWAKKAVEVRPQDPHGLNNLGMIYLETGAAANAASEFHKASLLAPSVPAIHANLGASLLQTGHNIEAENAFRNALRMNSNMPDARMGIGRAIFRQHRYAEALQEAQQALRMTPRAPGVHVLLANIFAAMAQNQEAEQHLRAAVQLDPTSRETRNSLAIFLQEVGRFEEAAQNLSQSVQQHPNQGTAYYCLVQSNNELDLIPQMEAIDAEKLEPEEGRMLHYALARAYENGGRYEESFQEYSRAHDLTYARVAQQYDRDREEQLLAETRRLFTKELMIEKLAEDPLSRLVAREEEFESDLPIIICGMIRSGTTLCEQILSSHREIGAAGEQWFWLERGDPFQFDAARLRSWAEQYVEQLESVAPDHHRVTDKMPGNHRHLGLIHLALPEAKIIHMKRDPADTCLSIYTTRINRPPLFGRTLADTAFAYRIYQGYMEHWRSVLPDGAMLELDYEELVSNGEAVARRMLDFLGLDWDERVLRHEVNARNVKTPSLWAVRQPLNEGSVKRWKRFEPWISELLGLEKQ